MPTAITKCKLENKKLITDRRLRQGHIAEQDVMYSKHDLSESDNYNRSTTMFYVQSPDVKSGSGARVQSLNTSSEM